MGRIAFQKSAGGVVIDAGRVLLIRTQTRAGRLVWTFPKGRIKRGERFWEAALREIREETGYLCRLKQHLRTTSYFFQGNASQVRKTVHWYLVEPIRKAGPPNPKEVVEVVWVGLPEALDRLNFRSDVGLLRAAVEALDRAQTA